MNNAEKLCRFCLRQVKDTYFDDLREPCDILSALHLKVDVDISEEPVICIDCIESLRKLFSFKVICVQSGNSEIPFINSHANKKIDLQHVYLEINGSKSLGNNKVCRFCMCETPISSSLELNGQFIPPKMYFLEFFPELEINSVRDPIICKTCHNSLHDHVTFTRKCMAIEDSIQKYIEVEGIDAEGKIDLEDAKRFMDKVIIKKEIEDGDTFKHETQIDEIVEEASSKVDLQIESYIEIEDSQLEIKSESTEVKPIVNSPERVLVVASTESRENYNKNSIIHSKKCHSSEVATYKCEIEECSFETKHKRYPINHQLIHKDVSEVMMYKCGFEGCFYETKRKYHLTTHKLIHKDVAEIIMYKCKFEDCPYETKYKSNLIQHKLTHKNISDVMMYKCGFEGCLYKTKYKTCLIRHVLIHKDPSEVTMYKCGIEDCSYETRHRSYLMKHKSVHKGISGVMMYKCGFEGCLYETERKYRLISHKLIHKDVAEIMMYKCGFEGCSYETRYKRCLIRHVLIHKDLSEVTMYKCTIEDCPYETKYKRYLISHKLIHKDISEIMMYKCGFEGCLYENKRKSSLKQHKLIHKDV